MFKEEDKGPNTYNDLIANNTFKIFNITVIDR